MSPWSDPVRASCDEATRFRAILRDPETHQRRLLSALVEANAGTAFGRAHRFASITNYEDYAAVVPITTYEEIRPYVERAVQGSPDELVAGPIRYAELTGGSTGGLKIVLFGAKAAEGYCRALQSWLAGLVSQWPMLASSPLYFALSPAGRTGGETIGALPLGTMREFDWFGDAGPMLASLSIIPDAIGDIADFDEWQLATCLHLLAARELALISIWSPTYLVELLQAMQRRRHELVDALANGARAGEPLPPPDGARAAQVASALRDDAIDTAALWPDLKVVSCWMDASSAPFAAELQRRIPHARFQAKGLMATEGVTTVPFGAGPGSPIAIESGFFEFADADGRADPLWRLRQGDVRRVILSNWSGFYRYDTEDLVEVVGFEGATPRLRFLGRAGRTSDLCGEKLTEHFVLGCIEQAIGPDGGFAFLAAAAAPHPHYQLWIETEQAAADMSGLAERMDSALSENPQYAYARRLGQLHPIVPVPVPDLYERYRARAMAEGRNLGHLKAPALLAEPPDDLGTIASAKTAD